MFDINGWLITRTQNDGSPGPRLTKGDQIEASLCQEPVLG
jgi:hypothetical protein